ncbi:MAG TPA: hypothetical protein VGM51_11665 [Armatimonadota bacterium]|jgi:hypothetical protein
MPTLWDKIIGTWAVAAGISLTFTFFKQYRAGLRYIYLLLIGIWIGLWGVQALRHAEIIPRWAMWALFGLGMITMLRDSARRYRETSAALRAERIARLKSSLSKPPDDSSS